MLAKRIIAHFMILLIALPPQAVMADMLTQNTLGTTGQAAGTAADTSTATANAVNPAVAAARGPRCRTGHAHAQHSGATIRAGHAGGCTRCCCHHE
ncbi:MAG: hypothetical protein IPK32_08935 [Verrucomicrobiaceae bacterium]|nr:hypothetical protein [Verrucomicrobiaceae bacterium]